MFCHQHHHSFIRKRFLRLSELLLSLSSLMDLVVEWNLEDSSSCSLTFRSLSSTLSSGIISPPYDFRSCEGGGEKMVMMFSASLSFSYFPPGGGVEDPKSSIIFWGLLASRLCLVRGWDVVRRGEDMGGIGDWDIQADRRWCWLRNQFS